MAKNDAIKILRRLLKEYPALHDELFKFSEPEIRELALADLSQLGPGDLAKLADRAKYLALTRIVHRSSAPPPRCRGKAIYTTEQFAQTVANRIWETGRGAMRIYKCPLCEGFHLTHQALR